MVSIRIYSLYKRLLRSPQASDYLYLMSICLSPGWYWYTYYRYNKVAKVTSAIRYWPLASDYVYSRTWITRWQTHSQYSLGLLSPSLMSACLSLSLVLIYIYSFYNKVAKITPGLSFCILRQLHQNIVNTFSMFTPIIIPFIDVCLPVWLSLCLSVCLSVCLSGIELHIFFVKQGCWGHLWPQILYT